MIALRNILLPTDFSEPSLQATVYAVELAQKFGATLHVLNVIEDPKINLPMFESVPVPSREEFETYAQTRLDNWILPEDAAGLEIETRWVHGRPFVEILNDAKKNDIDLIVLGTHGRSAVTQVLMGSVAEKIVRKAPCPVLTVRPKGHQFVHPVHS